MPTNDFAALVRELEEAARETIYASMSQDDRAAQRLAAETELADARAALLAYGAGVERDAEYPSDVPDVPRVIWEALNEVDPDWTGAMIEGDVRDSEHAAAAIRQLRAPHAAVIGRCITCRFVVTEDDSMECDRMSRVQFIGPPDNGTAYATPYEGCSAVLEVSPDFGCVLWKARKDGV